MTRQPDLYSPMLGSTRTKQGRLFDTDGPPESGLSCECGEPLVRTQSGFWSCPKGHGRLQEQANDARHWEGDDVDLFTTNEGD